MSEPVHDLGVFLHLSREYERRQRRIDCDRMLLLAGVVAAEMQLDSVAAHCRGKILASNPGHQIRRWSTLGKATADDAFQAYLKQFRRRYPVENAERILNDMGVQLARERDTYYDDQEYAAALLGTTSGELDTLYGNSGSD